MARQVVTELIADSKKFKTGIDDAASHAEKASGKFSSIFAGVGLGIGSKAFDLAAEGVHKFFDVLADSGKAYQEAEVSEGKLDTALKNSVKGWKGNTAAIDENIKRGMALGFSANEQRDSLAQLVGVTKDSAKALKLQYAAEELARLKGIDLATATKLMEGAAVGKTAALAKLGIQVKKGSDAEQIYADVMKVAGGQAETFANTSEGKLAAAHAKVEEGMAKVGAIMDKVSTVAIPILADAFSAGVDAIGPFVDSVSPLVDAFTKALPGAIATVQATFQPLFGLFGQAGNSSTQLGQQVSGVGETFGAVFADIQGIVGGVLAVLTTLWNTFGKDIMAEVAILVQYLQETLGNAMKVLKGIFDTFAALFRGDWNGVWNGIKEIFSGIWSQIGSLFKMALNLFPVLLDVWGKILGAAWSAIWNGLKAGVGAIWDGITGVVKGGVNGIIGLINMLIRALDSVQLHMHFSIPNPLGGDLASVNFDWNGFGIPQLPKFHRGGIVPGNPGEDVLAILQAGEQVTPAAQVAAAGGGGIHLHFHGPVYGGPAGARELLDTLSHEMRMMGAKPW